MPQNYHSSDFSRRTAIANRRPLGIWLACGYLILISVPGLAVLITMTSVAHNRVKATTELWLWYSFGRAGLLISAAAVLFFRGRPAIWLLLTDFCFSLAQELSDWNGHSVIHLCVKAGVYFYVWNFYQHPIHRIAGI